MSNGDMIEKKKIDKKVSAAKLAYKEQFWENEGYHFCERTKRSDLPLDCSHIISVRMCQATGQSELAWSLDNIELLSRDAHMALERWPNAKRQDWYWARKEGTTYKDFLGETNRTFW